MIRFVITLMLLIVVSSCAFLIKPEVTFVINNETPKDLSILLYEKAVLWDSIAIKRNEHYETTVSYDHPGNGWEITPFRSNEVEVDSLVILFSDGKRIIQYCDGGSLSSGSIGLDPDCKPEKNLMDFNTGTYKDKKWRDKSTKTITFEETDYEQAVLP